MDGAKGTTQTVHIVKQLVKIIKILLFIQKCINNFCQKQIPSAPPSLARIQNVDEKWHPSIVINKHSCSSQKSIRKPINSATISLSDTPCDTQRRYCEMTFSCINIPKFPVEKPTNNGEDRLCGVVVIAGWGAPIANRKYGISTRSINYSHSQFGQVSKRENDTRSSSRLCCLMLMNSTGGTGLWVK